MWVSRTEQFRDKVRAAEKGGRVHCSTSPGGLVASTFYHIVIINVEKENTGEHSHNPKRGPAKEPEHRKG